MNDLSSVLRAHGHRPRPRLGRAAVSAAPTPPVIPPLLLPDDREHAADERVARAGGQPLGTGLADRLDTMPNGVSSNVAAACEEGLGLP